jgi:hypothetical protein
MLENWAKLSGFAAIFAAVLSVSFLWALRYMTPQNVKWTCEAKSDSQSPDKPTLKIFSCHAEQSENLSRQATGTSNQGNQNVSEGIKITDVLLAAFTGMLVIVTAVLIVVGISQSDQLKRAVDAARDEFEATHRAKVRVRRINLQGSRNDFSGFTFFLANAGDADATIISISCVMARKENGAWLNDQSPDPRAFHGSVIRPQEPELPMGPARPFLLAVNVDPVAREAIRSRTHELFVIGDVEYTDRSNIIRTTGFCWVYDHGIRDFRYSAADDVYNYEG